MDSKDALNVRIRKLRKKLRQIEHLEGLERDLTDEELNKCIKKDSIREELHQLLSEFGNESAISSTLDGVNSSDVSWSNVSADSTPYKQDTESPALGSLAEEEREDLQVVNLVRTTEEHDEGNTSHSAGAGTEEEQGQETVVQRSPSPERDRNEFKAPLPSPPKKSKKSSKDKVPAESSLVRQWRNSGFMVTALESHNDIVTAVDCDESLIISASRDTTVKVWDEATLTELRSLGSHTGSVTDVILLSPKQYGSLGEELGVATEDKLILSGSVDCSIKVWSANTGELLRSVYTYNPVTKIAFHEGLSLVISTSDGGKLELWNLVTKQTVCSVLAHGNAITALCHDSQRVYTASSDDEIKIHEIREQSLKCVYVSENVRSLSGHSVLLRGVKSLVVKGDLVFCGDDGVNIKVLDWKKGQVKKLANHKEDYGMTDALCCHGDVLYSSAYDLDTGEGYVNVMDVTSSVPSYITTVDDEDTGRILDIAYCQPGSRAVTIVTAGTELKVWKQVPSSGDIEMIVPTKVIPRLLQLATDSDIESDVEFTESESEDNVDPAGRASPSRARSWKTWCCLM